ncbi:beta-lactamase/transpeptidase-like protein, partial [Plenodomus tracheiphilus IPT5]
MSTPYNDAWDGPLEEDAFDRLHLYIQKIIDDGHAYGACMIISRGGRAGRQMCFGVSDRSGKKITKEEDFVATSLANCFTALVVLRAIDHGHFTFETKISAILPCFKGSNKEGITIRQCLTHTSGLNSSSDDFKTADLEHYVKKVSGVSMGFAPGTRCSFTPRVNFAVLGQLLVVSDPKKRPFEQIMQQELFDPVGMRESRFGAASRETGQICITSDEGKTSTLVAPSKQHIFFEGPVALSGALWTTVKDVFRFADILRQRGCSERYRLISRSLFDYAAKSHTGVLSDDLWTTESTTE